MQRGTKIVIELLAAGKSASEVAEIIGCTDEEVLSVASAYETEITTKRNDIAISKPVTANEAAETRDQRLDGIEDALIAKMENMVPLQTDIMKVASVFKVVNGAKRRSTGEGHQGTTINNVVQLNLPEHIRKNPEYVLNGQSQVVSVGGRGLSVASTDQIKDLAGLGEETENDTISETTTNAVQRTGTGQVSEALREEAAHSTVETRQGKE
jgi:hypothetical protein